MRTKTENLLLAMNVLSWVTFIGLLIKAGAILISFGISIANPEGAKNLYRGWNLFSLRQSGMGDYTASVSFMVAIILLEAYIAFLVIKALTKIKMANPFTMEVSGLLEKISYFLLGTWVTAMLYNAHTSWLSKRYAGLQEHSISGEFIFLAGIVFVISQIFKRGVEIQSENDLTI